jgi:hypothetical protein
MRILYFKIFYPVLIILKLAILIETLMKLVEYYVINYIKD